ncbi:MAG: hypothetical protein KDB37_02905 [Ilumatobacter sp.]|nr:hypothetical protein [Ilumatobacter sp.]
MKLSATHLLRTAVGKTVVALLVVTGGVGAAAAARDDLPMLSAADEVDEPAEDVEPEDVEPADDQNDDDQDDGDQDDENDDHDGDDDQDDGEGSEEPASLELTAESDEEPNHGEVVSTFVHETELTGCEKGQATAAVARGDVDPTDADTDLDEALAPFVEKCSKGDGDLDAEDDAEPGDGTPWKQGRDDGRTDVDAARQAYVDACGDDESDESDEPKSEECQVLHDAMKQAHDAWKSSWHTARDEAKQQRRAGDDDTSSSESDETGERGGPPDHAKANGKDKASNGTSNGQGKGKP